MFDHNTVRRAWRPAAPAVALALVLAAPAAAGAGQQAAGEARAAAAPSQAVILSAPVSASCGLLPPACTVRLNRSMTRRARDAAGFAGSVGTAACSEISLPVVTRVCTGLVIVSAGTLATAATNYYEDGDCLAIKISPLPPPGSALPERVKHGDHNCS